MKLAQLILMASLSHLKPTAADAAPTSALIGARSKLPVRSYHQFDIRKRAPLSTESKIDLNPAKYANGRPWAAPTHSSSGGIGRSPKPRSISTKPQPRLAEGSFQGLKKNDLSANKKLARTRYPDIRRRSSARTLFAYRKLEHHSSGSVKSPVISPKQFDIRKRAPLPTESQLGLKQSKLATSGPWASPTHSSSTSDESD
ncbi:hypothetical protein O181_029174 [Austropuccinia psidii MF-1]|uniref:Uncharacterized protein n=1 Tax=Austropuccinia psidii MF-1 TaxID=1389203 RepID=A0A9Q3H4B2_9BASI|nr:hypothetical protein [Austropuccinia psidii MF-1]